MRCFESLVCLFLLHPYHPYPSTLIYHWLRAWIYTFDAHHYLILAWPELKSAEEHMRTNWLRRWPKHDSSMTKWQKLDYHNVNMRLYIAIWLMADHPIQFWSPVKVENLTFKSGNSRTDYYLTTVGVFPEFLFYWGSQQMMKRCTRRF